MQHGGVLMSKSTRLRRIVYLAASAAALIAGVPALAADTQSPSQAERAMIAEAQKIVRTWGDAVWTGFSQTPLPILLVDPEQETLFCGAPTAGFAAADFDAITQCSTQTRRRELPVDISAAADLDGSQLIIQMGLPAALDGSEADWIVTFLHEAFHQHQDTLPGYAPALERIRKQLERTGPQWMLDYPFPYGDPEVKKAFSQLTASALRFLESRTDQEADAAIAEYTRARIRAEQAIAADDWLYYEFQVGHEGVARWTELKLAALAGETRNDIAAIAQDRNEGLAVSLRAIDQQGVAVWKRSVFYVLGAIEAMMLDRVRPQWRRDYASDPFSLGALLQAAAPG